ncbi:MAG: phosphodiesterase [Lachnospiraceae bacterium]
MNLMIASDIHGSAFYCERLMEAWKREKPDKLLLLGDILYHGPRNDLPKDYAPKKVITMLNEIKDEILCVRGNCEAEVDQMVLEFPVVAEYACFYEEGHMIFATHGHVFNEKNVPPLKAGDILLHGHTHIPECTKHEKFTCLNPGSVSIPKGNSVHGYMMLKNGRFTWKNLDGEIYMEYSMNGEV